VLHGRVAPERTRRTSIADLLQRADGRQVVGGALFGIGGSIAGFCPDVAPVALSGGLGSAGLVVVAMLAGMLPHDHFLAPTPGPPCALGVQAVLVPH
jgi:uncharacterized membrane protein YedE/YeeE